MTRRGQARAGSGWSAIGIERGKNTDNLGTLWRSAVCFGASYVFTVGGRYHHQCSDTVKSWRHIPLMQYPDVDAFVASRPMGALVVGVELTDDARPLENYVHPERVLYLLGPEDGSLSSAAVAACDEVVRFSSRWCLNVAAAGTVVLYDRSSKVSQRVPSSSGQGHRPVTAEIAGSNPVGTALDLTQVSALADR